MCLSNDFKDTNLALNILMNNSNWLSKLRKRMCKLKMNAVKYKIKIKKLLTHLDSLKDKSRNEWQVEEIEQVGLMML